MARHGNGAAAPAAPGVSGAGERQRSGAVGAGAAARFRSAFLHLAAGDPAGRPERRRAPDGDRTVVEWEVSELVRVARVTGPHVRSWSRNGSRVQVWLERPVGATELPLAGWWLPPAGVPRLTRFELPRLLPFAAAVTTRLRVTAAPGLTRGPGKLPTLVHPPAPHPSGIGRDWAGLPPKPGLGGEALRRS